jgi:hypothetical protein
MALKPVHNDYARALIILMYPLCFNGEKKHFFFPLMEEDGRHESIGLGCDQYFSPS